MKSFTFCVTLFLSISLFSQSDSIKKMPETPTQESKIFYDKAIKVDKQVENNLVKLVDKEGKIEIEKDDRLDLLLREYNEQKKTYGYKIQLFSGKSRMEAAKVKSEFIKFYDNETVAVIIYKQPNFKLRVGNYRDRLEANKFLNKYKIDFPTAFIVKDEISVE